MSRTLQLGETVGPFTVEIPREMWLGLEFDAWLGWRATPALGSATPGCLDPRFRPSKGSCLWQGQAMTSCDICGKPTRVVVPFHAKPAATVYDDLTNPNRHLPRSALSDEQNAAIPWGTHPDDDRFGQACEDCARAMQGA